jgi:hypothetical protein
MVNDHRSLRLELVITLLSHLLFSNNSSSAVRFTSSDSSHHQRHQPTSRSTTILKHLDHTTTFAASSGLHHLFRSSSSVQHHLRTRRARSSPSSYLPQPTIGKVMESSSHRMQVRLQGSFAHGSSVGRKIARAWITLGRV